MAKMVELKGDVDLVTVCTAAIFCTTEEECLTCNSEAEQNCEHHSKGLIRSPGAPGMIYGFFFNELYEKSRKRSASPVSLIAEQPKQLGKWVVRSSGSTRSITEIKTTAPDFLRCGSLFASILMIQYHRSQKLCKPCPVNFILSL